MDGTTECIEEAIIAHLAEKGFAQSTAKPNPCRDVLHDLASDKLKLVYPQLARLASLGLMIPVSTADCEPAFSTMK